MKTKTILSILLIAAGVLLLGYSGLRFSTPGESIDFLGLHIATRDNHFIPPAVGAIMLLIGMVLLLVKPKRV